MAESMKTYTVPALMDGKRLDRVLGEFLSGGLRVRRRYCDEGKVFVNGKASKASLKVRSGWTLELICEVQADVTSASGSNVEITKHQHGFVALNKPAGIHSASLEGGGGQSVEHCFPEISQSLNVEELFLVNRLDLPTSGILLAAESPELVTHWRKMENEGLVCKVYAALVCGNLTENMVIKNKLDTDNRKKTKVLKQDDDELRHTAVYPVLADEDTTLVLVRIWKGARHHIRAHLAHAGHPIIGDSLYGVAQEGERLHLHNCFMGFEEFKAFAAPDWRNVDCNLITEMRCGEIC